MSGSGFIVCRLILTDGACGVNVNGADQRPACTVLRTVFIATAARASTTGYFRSLIASSLAVNSRRPLDRPRNFDRL